MPSLLSTTSKTTQLLLFVALCWCSVWVMGCETPPCGLGGGLYGECNPPTDQVSDAAPSDGPPPESPKAPEYGCACNQTTTDGGEFFCFLLLLGWVGGFWRWRRGRRL